MMTAHLKRWTAHQHMRIFFFAVVVLFLTKLPEAFAGESQCYGSVSNGRIEGSVKLPVSGPNFSAYSALGATAGRTHIHSKVAEIIVSAYAALEAASPNTVFVYGETGWPSGGRIRPHRTHQNGLSIDFFVPVRDGEGKSAPLPTSIANRLGYDIEFNANAKYEGYSIDFAAISEHLYQLQVAAQGKGVGIALVIFDTAFLPKLFATPRGKYLQENLPFMKGKPWVRHDEHYHIDFAVPCKPNAAKPLDREDAPRHAGTHRSYPALVALTNAVASHRRA